MLNIFPHRPLPQTVWSKDGRVIQSSDRVTQSNYGKSLIIKVVDFEDAGTYTCEVSNGVGALKSYSINLKVDGNINPLFMQFIKTKIKQQFHISSWSLKDKTKPKTKT